MSRQVLVIDSNSAVQAIALLALKHADCSVKALTDGSKAIEAIHKLKPHLVLCAKEIAGINALELCKQVRRSSPETLFILLAPAETPKEVVEQADSGFAFATQTIHVASLPEAAAGQPAERPIDA